MFKASAVALLVAIASGCSGGVSTSPTAATPTPDPSPPPCSYAISPTSMTLGASGSIAKGTLGVATAGTCSWTTAVSSGWLTVTPSSGSGSQSLAVVALDNEGASPRAATITVASQAVAVTQAGSGTPTPAPSPTPTPADCLYQLTSPKVVVFNEMGGSGVATFTQVAGATCAWTAQATGIVNVQDANGTGSILVRYAVPSWGTPTGCERTGLILVRWPGPQGGENISIVQRDQYCDSKPSTQAIAEYLSALHAQARTTFAADEEALERQAAAAGTLLTGGTVSKSANLYVASVQKFVDASLAFVRLKSQTVAIDRSAVSTLLSTYATQDATYASTYLYASPFRGLVAASFVAGIQSQIGAIYSSAISQLP